MTTATPLPTTPAQARELFPGLRKLAYLDVAGRSPLCQPVRAALDRLFDVAELGGDKPAMFRSVEAARDGFARLVNCHSDEVAVTKNISEGLNIVATAIDWRAGDKVVVCEALEHANNIYLWRNLRERLGVQVVDVPPRDGQYDVEAMAAAVDERTRIVTACTHTFTPGFRTDIRTLGEACRRKGALLLLDGAQSAGITHLDLQDLPVDALAVSTQKGLLGLYGMGFLYVRRELAERMRPVALARFGVDLGEGNEAAAGSADYRLMPGARRFDLGNYNFPGAVAMEASLALLHSIGSRRIEAHACGLARKLARELADAGLPVRGGAEHPARDHIVTVGQPGEGHGESGDARMQSLYEALGAADVKLSIRKDMLRFSFHVYNNEADVARVVDVARDWARRTGF